MFSHYTIFPPKDFKKTELDTVMQGVTDLDEKKKIIQSWQKMILNGSIYNYNEIQLQANFLFDFFGKILGYLFEPHLEERFLSREVTTENDMTRPDGVLGYFRLNQENVFEKDVRVVIELKDSNTHLDNKQRRIKADSPVNQAFSYAHKFGGKVKWVIVSNFVELRLYNVLSSTKYESFEIERLLEPAQLARFFFLLQKDRLFLEKTESPIDILLENRRAEELRIEFQFYEEYSGYRELLFFNLIRSNFQEDQHELLASAQKILDRILFIAFVRDSIPMANVLGKVRKTKEELAVTGEQWLWLLVKGLFKSFDKGFSSQVPTFNGGLFAFDPFLDEKLVVLDDYIVPIIDFILKYDYQSELNVNLLGHIFEQSISDLEKLKEKIDNKAFSSLEVVEKLGNEGLRKKDGIFYTPNFVTQYIVTQTVGEYLEKEKEYLFDKYQEENETYWTDYEKVLLNLKILDPACGSGAFLVAVFEFMWSEWKILLAKKSTTSKKANGDGLFKTNGNGNTYQEWKIKKLIVENNIFGVDLNMESVAISKLSLWILTANTSVSLAHLSENIKQGNSLVDDESISKRAFVWEKEFPKIVENQGFDVIVGNPPWGATLDKKQKEYLKEKFPHTSFGEINTYKYFIDKSLQLIKEKGNLSFIVPDSYLEKEYFSDLRKFIVNQCSIIKNLRVGDNIFEDVNMPSSIIFLKKDNSSSKKFSFADISKEDLSTRIEWLKDKPENIIYTDNQPDYEKSFILRNVFFRNTTHLRLIDVYDQVMGVKVYQVGKGKPKQSDFELKNNVFISNDKKDKNYLSFISQGIYRYYYETQNEYINYGEWLAEPRELRFFEVPKIVVREVMNERIFATIIPFEAVVKNIAGVIIQKDNNYTLEYLLCLLNSKLFSFCIKRESPKRDNQAFPSINSNLLKNLPIKKLENQQFFIEKANKMLDLQAKLYKSTKEFLDFLEKRLEIDKMTRKLENWYLLDWNTFIEELNKSKIKLSLKQQKEWKEFFEEEQPLVNNIMDDIKIIDNEIDKVVYQLYELSDEQVKEIENEFKNSKDYN
jgi:hypothetical protein